MRLVGRQLQKGAAAFLCDAALWFSQAIAAYAGEQCSPLHGSACNRSPRFNEPLRPRLQPCGSACNRYLTHAESCMSLRVTHRQVRKAQVCRALRRCKTMAKSPLKWTKSLTCLGYCPSSPVLGEPVIARLCHNALSLRRKPPHLRRLQFGERRQCLWALRWERGRL